MEAHRINKLPSRAAWLLLIVVAALAGRTIARGEEFPAELASAACQSPPTIDGKIESDEWKDASLTEFQMTVLNVLAQKTSTRKCQLWVMNSANALYVGLRVPDATENKSLSPLDFDLASLAFCRGDQVATGDDKKAVAPGIYLDKHVTTPGKDADDPQADGKGAMLHDAKAGRYDIEWAIPLDSGDKLDLQTKPGARIKFNLAYVDAFQADLKATQIGTIYPGGLDSARQWGQIQLASNVQDDGGVAFTGPAWIRDYFAQFKMGADQPLRVVDSTLLPGTNGSLAKVQVEYTYHDPKGQPTTGKAKLYLPIEGKEFRQSVPLLYSAGYELDDASAVALVGSGHAVVTPRALESNPLVRTANPDIALLHIARALPFLDDSRTIITGGSAGGYITLMLAAETFPLAGAAPAVPPINWGYNAAFFLQREDGKSRANPKSPQTPVYDVIVPIGRQAQTVYDADPSHETFYRHSPVAHVNTITSPVCVYWTTADMLVPIDQVGQRWVRPIEPNKFPPEFTFDPTRLTTSEGGRTRLTDVLSEQDYELFILDEASIRGQITTVQKTRQPAEIPVSATKRWSITILDEGAPEPQLGHNKYSVPWSFKTFFTKVSAAAIDQEQLTATKLQRLLMRYAGQEWLPSPLKHLDLPAREQADVVRGLRTYVAASPAHAQRFAELYAQVPADLQVLPAELVRELAGANMAN